MAVSEVELRVYGIRHHGPGSARALLAALADFAPDCVLVEGPPDAEGLIPWLAHPALELPVALLVYCPDEPRRATFYPFAVFSPEYQALYYALTHGAAAGFMDLSRRHVLAAAESPAMPPAELFNQLAAAAGRDGYEPWWNEAVEQRRETGGLFAAVAEMAAELRRAAEERPPTADRRTQRRPRSPDDGRQTTDDGRNAAAVILGPSSVVLAQAREAAMRQRIRRAAADGHRRIAAVCGAWHAPVLQDVLGQPAAPDDDLLRDLPAIDVAATWVPWTYGRMTQAGGYGAGVASPGWYEHLWEQGGGWRVAGGSGSVTRHLLPTTRHPTRVATTWLSKVGQLLRNEGFDTSPGHLIEAVRLAEALAALRGRPFPALDELNEAAQSVLCGGDAEPMALIRRRLIVGERMGLVPPDVPAVPLQRDLRAQQTRLRLRPEPEPSELPLDLRQEMHLERSRLLHQLTLLDIPWGTPAQSKGPTAGTFAELWQLQWRPDLALRVIEAAMWGNTVRDAAAARAADVAGQATDLPALIGLIDRAILADLPEAIPAALARIEELSAAGADVAHMLAALPPLAQTLRYGGLRHSADHLAQLRRVFDHLLTRACLALPRACLTLDGDAARDMAERLAAAAPAAQLVAEPRAAKHWLEALLALADRRGIHATVAGRATRLLHEIAPVETPETGFLGRNPVSIGRRLARALSGPSVEETRYAADWLDGLLRDSGLLIVHDRSLWAEVDGWLSGLPGERFVEVLPLLRRTFTGYPEGVREQLRRQLGRRGNAGPGDGRRVEFDPARAAAALPVVTRLLGL